MWEVNRLNGQLDTADEKISEFKGRSEEVTSSQREETWGRAMEWESPAHPLRFQRREEKGDSVWCSWTDAR